MARFGRGTNKSRELGHHINSGVSNEAATTYPIFKDITKIAISNNGTVWK